MADIQILGGNTDTRSQIKNLWASVNKISNYLSNGTVGNMSYSGTGSIGSHYVQSSSDGKTCGDSKLSEDATNFDFGGLNVSSVSDITATNFIKNGGSSDDFLKGDGSSDNNTYLTSSDLLNYVPKVGDSTITGNLTADSFIKNGGTGIQYMMCDGSSLTYSSNSGNSNYYLFLNGTDGSTPVDGYISYNNNATQSMATIIYISHLTSDGIDIEVFFKQLTTLSEVYIQDKGTSGNFLQFNITGTPTITAGQNVSIPVEIRTATVSGFTEGTHIMISFFTNSIEVDSRLSTVEGKTRNQSAISGTTTFSGDVVGGAFKVSGQTGFLKANGNIDNNTYLTSVSLTSTGTGTSLLNSTVNPFTTKSLAVGSGLTISTTSSLITLTSSIVQPTLSNAGTGTTLIVSGSGSTLSNKSITSGTGINFTNTANDITINSSIVQPTLSNAGTGTTLIVSGSGSTLSNKSITAGTGITFTPTTNDITINSSITQPTLSNAGTGTSLIVSGSGTTLSNKSITAGTNITFTNTANDIVINSASNLGTNNTTERWVNSYIGNDAVANGSLYPYATINGTFGNSAQYPLKLNIRGVFNENLVLASGQSNLQITTSDVWGSQQSTFNGSITMNAGFTRLKMSGFTLSSGTSQCLRILGADLRHDFSNMVFSSSNAKGIEAPATSTNWINFQDCDFTAMTGQLFLTTLLTTTGVCRLYNCGILNISVGSGWLVYISGSTALTSTSSIGGTVVQLPINQYSAVITSQALFNAVNVDGFYINMVSGLTGLNGATLGCCFIRVAGVNLVSLKFNELPASINVYNITSSTYDTWVKTRGAVGWVAIDPLVYPRCTTGDLGLRIIRGNISTAGAIQQGGGFTASRINTGQYTITYTTAFSSTPTVTTQLISSGSYAFSSITAQTTSLFTIAFANPSVTANVDTAFNFIVMGTN